MAIAITLEQYLNSQGIAYDAIQHKRTACAARSASASHIPLDQMAKGVVLSSRNGYVLAVVPASRQVGLDKVGRCIEQPVALATEAEIAPLFPDCEPGAVPAVGAAYGLQTVLDESLETKSDIYFEAGDHCTLLHIDGDEFGRLTRTAAHGPISTEIVEAEQATGYFGA